MSFNINKNQLSGSANNKDFQAGGKALDQIELTIGKKNSAGISGAAAKETDLKSGADDSNPIDQTVLKNAGQQYGRDVFQNDWEHRVTDLHPSNDYTILTTSRIKGADTAATILKNTTANILQQADTALLAQSNLQPQRVMKLLN